MRPASPAPPRMLSKAILAVGLSVAVLGGAGCKVRPAKVPGETDIHVERVTLTTADPSRPLMLDFAKLLPRLGMRPAGLLTTERWYSDFRVAEDRRRIEAWWRTFGYLDVEVEPGEVVLGENAASVAFRLREQTRYQVGDVRVIWGGAPTATSEAETARLAGKVPFATGEKNFDFETFRHVRYDLADDLRRRGHAHAMVYSRAYVDRTQKVVHWYFFVDAGPKTHVGSVEIVRASRGKTASIQAGAAKIPNEAILARAGLGAFADPKAAPDVHPYDESVRAQIERDLLDSGAFSSVYVRDDADTVFIVPGTAPDNGGELRPEQIDKDGNFIARVGLPEALKLTIQVVEAPRTTVRLRGTFEVDPTRADTTLGGSFWFRNFFGPLQHLVVEGRVGRGVIFGKSPGNGAPSGFYGDALVRSVHPGTFGRTGDLRLSARYRGDLYPGSYLHHVEVGPGVRSTLAPGLFVDADLLGTFNRAVDFGPFSANDREQFRLTERPTSGGAELQSSLVWDTRDNPVEATAGHLLALRGRYAPGGPLATHRFLNVAPDARLFVPISKKSAIAFRAQGEWSLLPDGDGVPLTARLFGGGAYGLRAYGQQSLAPRAQAGDRGTIPVGGLSLVETSVELRYLPPREQIGAVLFGDFGGASASFDPFATGASAAIGTGLRLRLWYLPAAVDIAWSVLRNGDVPGLHDAPVRVFFRIGEAF